MVYDYLVNLIGSGSNEVVTLLSGFFVVMTYIIGVEMLIQGFRLIFYK